MSAFTYVDALTEEVCRFLLAEEDVGRIAFVDDDGYPVVLPVNYVLADDFIVSHRPGEQARGSSPPTGGLRGGPPVDHLPKRLERARPGTRQEVTTALDPRHARLRDPPVEPGLLAPRTTGSPSGSSDCQDDGSSAPALAANDETSRSEGPHISAGEGGGGGGGGERRAIRLTH